MTNDDGGSTVQTVDEHTSVDARRLRWWPTVGAIAALAVVASLIGAFVVRIPYFLIAPGNAVDVVPLVKVVDGPSYRPRGAVFLCTVSLQRATLFEAFDGWLDPSVDVVKEDVVVPRGVPSSDLQRLNLHDMATSKQSALGVAFEQLGYDAIRGRGAAVVSVVHGSPADGVLRAGQTIVAVDGAAVALGDDAVRLLGTHRPGDVVTLRVAGAGTAPGRELTVKLTANPTTPSRPFLGVTLRTRSPSFHFPYRVDIASEQIGGPSAGLAFTLEVLDVLTEGELTGGTKVAATGTIGLDGSVGEVGGVAQKTVAVRRAGVKLFLVPKDELAEARRRAGSGLRVEPVESLGDALRILATVGGNGLALASSVHAGA